MTKPTHTVRARISLLFGALLIAGAAFVWGVVTVAHKVFPYNLLQAVQGSSPHQLPHTSAMRYQLFEHMEQGADIVMLGDSITRAGEWAEFFSYASVANRGVDSDTSERVLQRLGSVVTVEPHTVVLMVGINDIFQGVDLKDTVQNVQDIITRLRAENIRVVLMSTLHCATPKCVSQYNDLVTALNIELAGLADNRGVLSIDLNNVLAPEGVLLSQYTYDGVHLSPLAYLEWVNSLKNHSAFSN